MPHRGRGRRAEQPERRVLGRVERDLHIVVSHAPRLPGRHQCQLVGGQCPRHAGRHDERDPLEVALVEIAQQSAEELGVGLRGPGEHLPKGGFAAGPDCDQQRIVGQALARAGDRNATLSIDLDQRVPDELGVGVRGDIPQWVVVRAPAAERFGDRHRTVNEVGVSREQRQLDAVTG